MTFIILGIFTFYILNIILNLRNFIKFKIEMVLHYNCSYKDVTKKNEFF
jgi:hypothetical protein